MRLAASQLKAVDINFASDVQCHLFSRRKLLLHAVAFRLPASDRAGFSERNSSGFRILDSIPFQAPSRHVLDPPHRTRNLDVAVFLHGLHIAASSTAHGHRPLRIDRGHSDDMEWRDHAGLSDTWQACRQCRP